MAIFRDSRRQSDKPNRGTDPTRLRAHAQAWTSNAPGLIRAVLIVQNRAWTFD